MTVASAWWPSCRFRHHWTFFFPTSDFHLHALYEGQRHFAAMLSADFTSSLASCAAAVYSHAATCAFKDVGMVKMLSVETAMTRVPSGIHKHKDQKYFFLGLMSYNKNWNSRAGSSLIYSAQERHTTTTKVRPKLFNRTAVEPIHLSGLLKKNLTFTAAEQTKTKSNSKKCHIVGASCQPIAEVSVVGFFHGLQASHMHV